LDVAPATSRTITIARLISAAPRLAVDAGVDPVYADVLSCVAGLVPLAMYSYVTIDPERLAAAAERVFPMLGLSGTLAGRPRDSASAHPTPTDNAARALIAESLQIIERALDDKLAPGEVGFQVILIGAASQ
jgi:hypothetical protein